MIMANYGSTCWGEVRDQIRLTEQHSQAPAWLRRAFPITPLECRDIRNHRHTPAYVALRDPVL